MASVATVRLAAVPALEPVNEIIAPSSDADIPNDVVPANSASLIAFTVN